MTKGLFPLANALGSEVTKGLFSLTNARGSEVTKGLFSLTNARGSEVILIGSTAPTLATTTFNPALTLGAPQTIFNNAFSPIFTTQHDNFSAFGCFTQETTSPITTLENFPATGVTASTVKPSMAICSVNCSVVNAGFI